MHNRSFHKAILIVALPMIMGSCDSLNPVAYDNLVTLEIPADYPVGENQQEVFRYYLALHPEDHSILAIGEVVPGETLSLDPTEPFTEDHFDLVTVWGTTDYNEGINSLEVRTHRSFGRGAVLRPGFWSPPTPRANYPMPEIRLLNVSQADNEQYQYTLRTTQYYYVTLPGAWVDNQYVFPAPDLPASLSGRYILLRTEKAQPQNMAYQAVENILDDTTPIEFSNENWITLPTHTLTNNLPGASFSTFFYGIINEGGYNDLYYLNSYTQNNAGNTFYFPNFGPLFDQTHLSTSMTLDEDNYRMRVSHEAYFEQNLPSEIPQYAARLENPNGDFTNFQPTQAQGDNMDYTWIRAALSTPDVPYVYFSAYGLPDSPIDFVIPVLPDSLHPSLQVLQQLDQAEQRYLRIHLTELSSIDSYQEYVTHIIEHTGVPKGTTQ